MRSVMNHQFSQVPRAEIPRSRFNRSHAYKTTFDADYIIPFYVDEALPGDTFNVRASILARLATPIAPIMDNLFIDTFWFSVPIRLVWEDFVRMCGEADDPGDIGDVYTVPTITATTGTTGYAVGTLSDYFGIPTQIPDIEHSALWHRAYALIWNQWFRDQNLQDSIPVNITSSNDTDTDYVLQKRGKRHDYFTSCLPWPQKGVAVGMPMGGVAPVLGIGKVDGTFGGASGTVRESDSTTSVYPFYTLVDGTNPQDQFYVKGTAAANGWPQIFADLSQATAPTINALREAFQVQKFLERDARGGTRYVEKILAHFGVTSPDARLQRSEYLGGISQQVLVNPVVQQSASDTQPTPQGNLAAFGVAAIKGNGFVKSFTEHTLLFGMCCLRSDITYQQGLDRMWSRSTEYDFYWPAFAHLGEQAVLRKEIFMVDPAGDTNDIVFGYQERYAEYRYKPSKITGKFRSTYAQSLDLWHLSEEFTVAPVLDAAFIVQNTPMDRISAVPTEPDMLFDSYINVQCARPMPLYGVPGNIDRF